jgi:hypothetical protein
MYWLAAYFVVIWKNIAAVYRKMLRGARYNKSQAKKHELRKGSAG